MLGMAFGIMKGLKRGTPSPLAKSMICSSIVSSPPIPLPQITPTRVRSSFSKSSPLSRKASSATHTENWVKRSILRASFLSITVVGSNPLTSPANCVLYCDASKAVIGAIPFSPFTSARHVSGADLPTGVNAPRPVITTRFNCILTPCPYI